MNKRYLSDYIKDDYMTWHNETVIFDCGTGCGKTYFCINVLGKYAKENNKTVLILSNRKKLNDQIEEEIVKHGLEDNVKCTLYQYLENRLINNTEIPHFDYIIADECHYFINDANFNNRTDLSYRFIIDHIVNKDNVIILMSATCKVWFKSLKDNLKVSCKSYYVERDYSYIKDVYFYDKKLLFQLLHNILNETDDKVIVFCSGNRLLEAYEEFGKLAEYYYSEYADRKLKKLPRTENVAPFTKHILFTTIALDNGVDIYDDKLHHVFCEIFEPDTLVQCIGRKRIKDNNDWCNVYIKEYTIQGVTGKINGYEKSLKVSDLYKRDINLFNQKYMDGRKLNNNNLFYNKNNECRLNILIDNNYILNQQFALQVKNNSYKETLLSYLDEQFRSKVKDIKNIDKEYNGFVEFLKFFINKRLYVEDRKIIKEKFKEIYCKRDNGIKTFNALLEENYSGVFDYRFYDKDEFGKPYKDTKRKLTIDLDNPHYLQTYWILKSIK